MGLTRIEPGILSELPNLLFDGLIELVKDIFKNVIALKLILNGNNIAE